MLMPIVNEKGEIKREYKISMEINSFEGIWNPEPIKSLIILLLLVLYIHKNF